MPIDPISRQPEPPEPDDPPPIGTGPRAASNLFAPDRHAVRVAHGTGQPGGTGPPAEPPPDATHVIYRVLTDTAVSLAREPSTGLFTVENFGEAVQYEFELRSPPDPAWCREVLSGIGWVTRMPRSGAYKVQTG